MQLREFDIDGFLRDYWQQKPLLIRNPWSQWRNPLDPDELAGLACEDHAEARLIAQTGDPSEYGWQVEHGPLPESRFGQVDKQPWTLLVQAVDHHVPSVASLITPFRFIPNWRIDDVMVSYASDGGGVGPHFDHYDVFLIQGLGKRRWQVGAPCDSSTELLPHDDLRLLANFEPDDEWILEPGDILYVPPRLAHNGVAVGDDCMTYSIGFRSPSQSELIAHFCDDVLAELQDENRYGDPQLAAQENPGEISESAIAQLHAMIAEKMLDREGFARWFGQYSSTRKYPDIDWQPEQPITVETLRQCLASDASLHRNPASRFAFVRRGANCVLLFVDGQCFECKDETIALAELLCAREFIIVDADLRNSEPALKLLAALFNQGSLAFELEA
ncbi:MAG: cupin domain-containing protein [Novosphingobium sp.]|nr:cupin domain-containing protein [Novosphingobium sp.]